MLEILEDESPADGDRTHRQRDTLVVLFLPGYVGYVRFLSRDFDNVPKWRRNVPFDWGYDDRSGRARIVLAAGPQHANPMGTLHGGILCDIADAAIG